MYVGPHTLLIGAGLGALGGYVLHHGAHAAHLRIKRTIAYREELQAYLAQEKT